ncbi:MAG: hypothetical protein JST00_07825 [Deltaproteobacteria bacterium]|nr:hypothetical protein [Deltaproteobacteria bacterium]
MGDDAARRRARFYGLLGCSLVVALYAWWPVLAAWNNTQWGDGQAFHKLVDAGRVSLVRYRELPFWDPYECGGRPLWDNPQAMVSSPFMLMLLPGLGTTLTMKLWYIAHTAAGFVSMWLFCRMELRVSRVAAFVGATAWACCGFNMHHLSTGHASFAAFELMPLLLLFWRRAEKSYAGAIGTGFVLAHTATSGGALALSYMAALLGLETLTRLWPLRRVARVVRGGAVAVVVTVGIGGYRLLPMIDQLLHHKRPIPHDADFMSAEMLINAFVNRVIGHMARTPDHAYVWGEYGSYVGWVLLLLASCGIVLGGLEQAWLFVLLVLGVMLMAGHWHKLSPWAILNHRLYPFTEMRVPSRFRAQASMMLLAYAAIGTDRLAAVAARLPNDLAERLSRSERLAGIGEQVRRAFAGTSAAVRLTVLAVALLGAGDVLGRGMQLVSEMGATSAPANKAVRASARLYYGGPDQAGYIDLPRQNRGRIACYDEWGFYVGAPMWEGDVPQARADDPAVVISNVTRTQNTFVIDVSSPAGGRIKLNSSFDFNWRSTVGSTAEENKLLVLDVPPGAHHLEVFYRPRSFVLGAILTLLTTILAIRALVRMSRGAHPLADRFGEAAST